MPIHLDPLVFWNSVNFKPTDDQEPLLLSPKRFATCVGGERAGKSMCAARRHLPRLLNPNSRLWVIAPDLADCEGIFEWLTTDIETLAWQTRVLVNKPPRNYRIELANGSIIEPKTCGQLTSIRGLPVTDIIITEAEDCPPDIWDNYARGRLSDKLGWATIEGTPFGANWLKSLRAKTARDPDWSHHRLNAEDVLPESDLAEKKRNMVTSLYDQKVKGIATPSKRIVFSRSFDDEANVSPLLPDPACFTALTIDSGYRFPAALWIASLSGDINDPDNKHLIFDQYVADDVPAGRLADQTLRARELNAIFLPHDAFQVESDGSTEAQRWHIVAHSLRRPAPNAVRNTRLCRPKKILPKLQELFASRRLCVHHQLRDETLERGIWKALHAYQYNKPSLGDPDAPNEDGITDHIMSALITWCANMLARKRKTRAPRAKTKNSRFPRPRKFNAKGKP